MGRELQATSASIQQLHGFSGGVAAFKTTPDNVLKS